jgi:ASC-1-like (ASCH) protein
MKNWTVRFRVVDKARFEEVRSGRKKYETRAATVKYEPMVEGDTVTFTCGKERFKKRIMKKYHFKTAAGMLKKLPLKRIMPDPAIKTLADVRARYATYPDYPQKIKMHGLFAFELGEL